MVVTTEAPENKFFICLYNASVETVNGDLTEK